MTDSSAPHPRERRYPLLPLILVGVFAGALSGLFGVGGGTIIVPALVIWVGMPQKMAAGTSVAAILPSAIVGAISYALQGHVDWAAALCLAVGIVAGAQLGSFLLSRLPVSAIQWGFMGFLLIVIVSLWFVVPSRDDAIALTLLTGGLLVLTGFATGVLSGLVGVGGGVVVVPVLMFFFGASDLIAKGTSLVMMIPGSISGTLGNLRRQKVDLRAALAVGIAASASAPFGTLLAVGLDPFWGNAAFSIFLLFILAQMLYRKLRSGRA
ncbi:sulfite exporter TauE/SafE family protein [Leucobacter sp. GX24907]